ncbi:MAG: VanZ family protein [Chloroflexi bacterium]|nr:VanZ family protein [Chloroflexota bacterium]MCY3914518.1 VanZ family protein [Chloroflexota bacterium]
MKHHSHALNPAPARWTLAIGWTLLLTLFLLQPEAEPLIDLGLPRGESTLQRELFFSALHLLAFALTCFIWFWTIHSALTLGRRLLAAVLIAISLGIVTEALQSLTLDRHASLIDLIANIAGALVAARLIWQRYK